MIVRRLSGPSANTYARAIELLGEALLAARSAAWAAALQSCVHQLLVGACAMFYCVGPQVTSRMTAAVRCIFHLQIAPGTPCAPPMSLTLEAKLHAGMALLKRSSVQKD